MPSYVSLLTAVLEISCPLFSHVCLPSDAEVWCVWGGESACVCVFTVRPLALTRMLPNRTSSDSLPQPLSVWVCVCVFVCACLRVSVHTVYTVNNEPYRGPEASFYSLWKLTGTHIFRQPLAMTKAKETEETLRTSSLADLKPFQTDTKHYLAISQSEMTVVGHFWQCNTVWSRVKVW